MDTQSGGSSIIRLETGRLVIHRGGGPAGVAHPDRNRQTISPRVEKISAI